MAKQVHHATRLAADKDLAEGAITDQSHRAVLAGQMDLATARNIGADDGPTDTPEGRSGPGMGAGAPGRGSADQGTDRPPQPVSRISKDDTRQLCWCGCEQLTSPGKRWKPGHDARGKGIIKRAVRDGKVEELSPQLKEYGTQRGLIR